MEILECCKQSSQKLIGDSAQSSDQNAASNVYRRQAQKISVGNKDTIEVILEVTCVQP